MLTEARTPIRLQRRLRSAMPGQGPLIPNSGAQADIETRWLGSNASLRMLPLSIKARTTKLGVQVTIIPSKNH